MSYGFKFLVLFLWVPGLILGTEPPPNAKTMNYKTCSTSECHKNIKDKKIIHGPTEANGCYLCHTPILGEHKYTLVKDSRKMCTSCHEDFETYTTNEKTGKPFITTELFTFATHPIEFENKNMPGHPEILFSAVADFSGDPFKLMCHVCHNPNEGRKQDKFLTKQDTTMQLCATCHGKEGSKLYKNFHEVRKKLKNEKL